MESYPERMVDLTEDLHWCYVRLRRVCRSLPVRLLLPTSDEGESLDDVMEAVHESAGTIADQPMPGGIASILVQTMHLWVGGALLVSLASTNEGELFYCAAAEQVRQIRYGLTLVESLTGNLGGPPA